MNTPVGGSLRVAPSPLAGGRRLRPGEAGSAAPVCVGNFLCLFFEDGLP